MSDNIATNNASAAADLQQQQLAALANAATQAALTTLMSPSSTAGAVSSDHQHQPLPSRSLVLPPMPGQQRESSSLPTSLSRAPSVAATTTAAVSSAAVSSPSGLSKSMHAPTTSHLQGLPTAAASISMNSSQHQPHQQRQQQPIVASHLSNNPNAVLCVVCGFAGADLCIKCKSTSSGSCGASGSSNKRGGCAYHARCIDLTTLANTASSQQHASNNNGTCSSTSSSSNSASGSGYDSIFIKNCPHCNLPAEGLEIIPLSFVELDRAQRMALQKRGMMMGNSGASIFGGSLGGSSGATATTAMGGAVGGNIESSASELSSKKRSSSDLEASSSSTTNKLATGRSYPSNIAQACRIASSTNSNTNSMLNSTNTNSNNNNTMFSSSTTSHSQCYNPATPRTGRWTDEELSFRDAIIAHFLSGSLPLSNGVKLNDFLSSMLKSKQSRLTKKMKHAKLSTKYFRVKSGHITSTGLGAGVKGSPAKEFSELEYNFVNVIADPIERSEISFHMMREWRDHVAERCTYLRLQFDASEWLKSVDTMDRRVALEKNRSRMVKRRCLMGKAMEKDVSESIPGVFINQRGVTVGSTMGSSIGGVGVGGSGVGVPMMSPTLGGRAFDGTGDDDGEFGRFLMSMLDEAPITDPGLSGAIPWVGGGSSKKALGGVRSSYCDPNFRYAAPFLAGITSYIERNGVPFEHVDIWVPSTIPPSLESEQSAPIVGSMGSGSSSNLASMGGGGPGAVHGALGKDGAPVKGGVTRLCFAGSATLSRQIVEELAPPNPYQPIPKNGEKKAIAMIKKVTPLSEDEIFNLSLYGDYSEKFSFSSGCGLPGRVYQTGVAAWEQFLAHAPPEMFERRGGAIQFGIKTALGLPIDSPSVGRIVLVLYSKHNRNKDEELVNRMVKDVRLFNPCPRWKLVVDVRSTSDSASPPCPVMPPPASQPPSSQATGLAGSTSFSTGMSALSMTGDGGNVQQQQQQAQSQSVDANKNNQIVNLISLLQENMPSDPNSPLGKQLNSIMSLRMTLLRGAQRNSEEEQLVETILVLYESYLAAGRTRGDIALLVARDYDFHIQHQQHMSMMTHQPPSTMTEHPIGIPLETNTLVPGQPSQHYAHQQPMMHGYTHHSPMAPPRAASTASPGSFIPPPVPLNPLVGQQPMMQNVHQYATMPPPPHMAAAAPGGLQPMDIQHHPIAGQPGGSSSSLQSPQNQP